MEAYLLYAAGVLLFAGLVYFLIKDYAEHKHDHLMSLRDIDFDRDPPKFCMPSETVVAPKPKPAPTKPKIKAQPIPQSKSEVKRIKAQTEPLHTPIPSSKSWEDPIRYKPNPPDKEDNTLIPMVEGYLIGKGIESIFEGGSHHAKQEYEGDGGTFGGGGASSDWSSSSDSCSSSSCDSSSSSDSSSSD